MKRVVLVAFQGEFMCFIHVLLNAIDMNEKGIETKIVIEGAATKLIPELATEGNAMFNLYKKARKLDLIDGVCMACSNKMGTLEAAKAEGLRLLNDMQGHPSMTKYIQEGFEIVTF